MNLGAEPKKVAILAAVILAGIGLKLYSPDDSAPAPAPRPAVSASPAVAAVAGASATGRTRSAGSAATEFRLRQGSARPEDKVDPSTIDPELRFDLLARVQAVESVAPGRNLFQFGAAPPPDKPLPGVPSGVGKIPVSQPPRTAPPPGGSPSRAAVPPAAPPINLKYYGYVVVKSDGHREAFLLDGDDIIKATENQLVKQRYRILRIALTSIEVEDIQSKSTQTLKLQETTG